MFNYLSCNAYSKFWFSIQQWVS